VEEYYPNRKEMFKMWAKYICTIT